MSTQIAELVTAFTADLSGLNKGFDKAEKQMNGFGKTMSGLVGGALAATATAGVAAIGGLTATIAKSVHEAGNLEQQAANISAVFGDMAPPVEEVKGLINNLSLDPKLVVGVKDAGQMVEMLAKNGLEWDAIAKGAARSVTLLANATGADFSQSADIATNAMGIFSLGVQDLDKVVATFTNAANKSQFDVNDWGYVLANAGPAANALGWSLEELFATVTMTSSAFASGREAGTSFEYLMKGLTPSTDTAKDAMKELGLITEDGSNAFFNADGSAKSYMETVGILQRAFGGLSVEQRMISSEAIFGATAYGALEGVLNLNLDTLKQLTPTMTDFSAVEKGAATRTNTYQAAMAALADTFNSLFSMIGDKFLPIFTQMARGFASFVKENAKPIVEFFGDFANELGNAVTFVTDMMNRLSNEFSLNFAIITSENASWGEKMLAIWDMLYTVGMKIWGSLIDGVIALVPEWLNSLGEWGKLLWQWIVDNTPEALAKLGEWAGKLWGWLVENAPQWASNLWEWAKATWQWIVEVTPIALAKLGELGRALMAGITAWAFSMGPVVSDLWNIIVNIFTAAYGLVTGQWNIFWSNLENIVINFKRTMWPILQEWGRSLWQWIVDVTPQVVQKLGEWAASLFNWLGANVPRFLSTLAGWGQALWQWIVTVTPTVLAKLGEWAGAIWNWLVANGPPIFGVLNEWGTALWAWIQEAFGPVAEWLGKIAAEFLSWKDVVAGAIIALGVIFWPTISAAFTAVVTAIGGFVSAWAPILAIFVAAVAAVALLRNAWERDWGGIRTSTMEALDFVKTAFQPVMDAIKQFGGDALKEIIAWATGNKTNFEAAGRIWDAAKTAFTTVFNAIGEKLVEWGGIAWEWFKENFPNAAAALMLAVDNIKRNFNELWTAAQPLILKLKEAWTAFTKGAEAEGGFLAAAMKRLQILLDGTWTVMITAVGWAINTFINLFTLVIQLINGDWYEAWQTIKQMAKGTWDMVVTIVRTAINSIAKLFGYSIEDVEAWLQGIGTKIREYADRFKTWGRNLIDGLRDGIEERWRSLTSWFQGAWEQLANKFKSFFGIRSPSTLFADYGKDMMTGLAQGIEGSSGMVVDAMNSLTSNMMQTNPATQGSYKPTNGNDMGGYIPTYGDDYSYTRDPQVSASQNEREAVEVLYKILAAIEKNGTIEIIMSGGSANSKAALVKHATGMMA